MQYTIMMFQISQAVFDLTIWLDVSRTGCINISCYWYAAQVVIISWPIEMICVIKIEDMAHLFSSLHMQ